MLRTCIMPYYRGLDCRKTSKALARIGVVLQTHERTRLNTHTHTHTHTHTSHTHTRTHNYIIFCKNTSSSAGAKKTEKETPGCQACMAVFKERRYLALHVRNRACRGLNRGRFQCPRCGKTGDEEWASKHDYNDHYQKWFKDWTMLW